MAIDPARIAVGGGLTGPAEMILPALGRRREQAVPFPSGLVPAHFVLAATLRGAIALAADACAMHKQPVGAVAMEVVIVPDRSAGGALVGGAIAALVSRQPDAVLGLATGSSPEPVYADVVARHQAGSLSVRQARAFLLDEYVGLPPDHPQSYRAVIEREVTSRLDFRSQSVSGPDGNAEDLLAACAAYDAQIAAAGGVDLQLLGIGSDGHIGFNEPGSSLGSRTRLKTLTSHTRADNARFFGGDAAAVPSHVITQGVGTILTACHLVLVAWGDKKADAVARCVEGPITAIVPASALQLHPHATVVIDEAAAAKLTLADYFRETWSAKPSWQGL